MSLLPALIIAGPGSNRERDLALALELAGADPTVVTASELIDHPRQLRDARLVAIAGGFSYGDVLGAGHLLALDLTVGIGDELQATVDRGCPVIGVGNGFQVLIQMGFLPGGLGRNAHGAFECRWVAIDAASSRCVWTTGIEEPIHAPIAHQRGRYVHPDPASLADAGQVAFRYRSADPNGSVELIAGVCNAAGNVLGLMPHPENFVVRRQHPHASRRRNITPHSGLRIFENGVAAGRDI
ncbi:MAG: phosphoribosylformylglycinamidine synthase [Ilumatobacter coccineus]|uniref:Phosphoribosylformylglycinamidine synthase n=1 Tax=Ilumatobacter coccineus TaxID=467094 RepID=A0A2G6K967_9ACTN|nr:MAG: phosphoribosylformylglycinamidine synthase [Ilumatobacter coccineus]